MRQGKGTARGPTRPTRNVHGGCSPLGRGWLLTQGPGLDAPAETLDWTYVAIELPRAARKRIRVNVVDLGKEIRTVAAAAGHRKVELVRA
jgi:hypothetical protein